jgi:hypothetical protein
MVQQFHQANRTHIFAVPAHNSTKLLPRYDQWRVQEKDRPAFAKAYGVSEHDLLRVSRGEIPSAGVVRQGTSFGTLDTSRQRLLAEAEMAAKPREKVNMSSVPAAGPFYGAKQNPGHEERPSAPVFNMVKDWPPAD